MVKISVAFRLQYLTSAVTMTRRSIRAHYEQMPEFERGCSIGLKEGGRMDQKIARYISQSEAAIRRCKQEEINNHRYQSQNGSGRPTANWSTKARNQSNCHSTGFILVNYPS
ncbi:hypothetical protein TNCV_2422721 [Trichonephila clavipes]|nr:hypothetical protein TNCV_2422721 [Trichonephila clavipes]